MFDGFYFLRRRLGFQLHMRYQAGDGRCAVSETAFRRRDLFAVCNYMFYVVSEGIAKRSGVHLRPASDRSGDPGHERKSGMSGDK